MSLYEEVRTALNEHGLRPRKSLGQNFLVHERVIEGILRLLALSPDDQILEIGPGLGFLTRRLVEIAASVWAVEVDRGFAERLRQGPLGMRSNFELIEGDVLTVPLEERLPKQKIKVVGNLPYNISTPVLFRLFELRNYFSFMVLMLQKEVADRIASGTGSKDYGTLSVWCQLHGTVTDKISVSPEAFFPKPKVRSTVLKIELRPDALLRASEIPIMRDLLRAAFGQRRKTLSDALMSWLQRERPVIDRFLSDEHIDPQRRGETLSVAEFIKLARSLAQHDLTGVAC